MNGQNPSDDPVKSPEIQEIIMSYRIGIIAAELAKRLDISPVRALQVRYGLCNCSMKARLALTCTTNVQGFICMAIFTLPMSLCGNVSLLLDADKEGTVLLFLCIPEVLVPIPYAIRLRSFL